MKGLFWRQRRKSSPEDKPEREGRRLSRDRRLVGKGTVTEGGRTAREERTVKECIVVG